MQKQLANFLDGVRRSQLLNPEQLEELRTRAEEQDADPQLIAKEIVQKGWLTAFQVKMFWKGRGAELILNQYVLLDRLGEGGMGEVFHARHRRMDRDVALKVIRRERLNSPDAIKRFTREIQAAARLAHENIVMAYDADQAGGRHFFAMEYVEGSNLAKLVKHKGPLPITLACDCIRQAALALQHAHDRGMLHRDIKPSNLLLNKQGALKILDMGLARLFETAGGEEESRITQEGLIVGTPDFLAPEQARNARAADIRADIYALGCTFYYILCAQPPYPGGTPTEKMLRHTVEPIPELTRDDVPPEVAEIAFKMLAKKPEHRFQLPEQVAYALQPYCGDLAARASSGMVARPPQPEYQQSRNRAASNAAENDPSTDSRFKLPSASVRGAPGAESRRRGKPWLYVGGSVLMLAVLASAAWLIFSETSTADSSLDKQFKNGHEMTFALIPAGAFEMGSPDDEAGREANEGPVHQVKISQNFYMSVTEITLRQYHSVLKRYPRAYGKTEPLNLDVPVTHVALRDVNFFLDSLNRDPNNRKVGWEYRLPREAEWEYACRAGSRTRFHTGNSITKEQANLGDAAAKGPSKVAQYSPNAWGLYDMHGNAAEWVYDYYDEAYYGTSPSLDPRGPEQRQPLIVVRGGSYLDPADWCRSAHRKGTREEYQAADLGFRVVMVPVAKP